jgi:hypothetical protein
MSTQTAGIGSRVATSIAVSTQTAEIGSCEGKYFKISPCFEDGEEEEAGGLGRRKQIRGGRRRRLGEDEAMTPTGPHPGKQTWQPVPPVVPRKKTTATGTRTLAPVRQRRSSRRELR